MVILFGIVAVNSVDLRWCGLLLLVSKLMQHGNVEPTELLSGCVVALNFSLMMTNLVLSNTPGDLSPLHCYNRSHPDDWGIGAPGLTRHLA